MTPTRELALQVSSDLAKAATKLEVRVLTIYGGVGYDEQLDTLSDGVDVVVTSLDDCSTWRTGRALT